MNVNATEATLQAVTEALKLAALLDPRMPNPDKATLIACAEQVQRHNFTDADLAGGILLDPVQDYYDRPSDRPIGIGDIIAAARKIRQDRYQRQELEQIEAANDAMDARLAPLIAELAEAKSIPDDDEPLRYQRPGPRSPRLVACPWCKVGAGQPCYNPATKRAFNGHHPARIDAAAKPDPTTTAIPLCRVCGARALLAIHETQRGICDWCTPAIGDPQPHPNGDRGTA
jgi:hypothetical protein